MANTTDTELCFFSPAKNTVIDVAIERDGAWVSAINGNSLAELGARYADPAIRLMPFDEAIAVQENSWKSQPKEITEADWNYALNVLPPVGWVRDATGESFKMSERISGLMTSIYVRYQGRYYSFTDKITTQHADVIALVAGKVGVA